MSVDGLFPKLTSPKEIIAGHPLSPLPLPTPEPPTYFPYLDRSVTHDWIDSSLVTDKAAKTDDAEIPVHLWNQRTTLLLNITIASLNALRHCFFEWVCRQVYCSFCEYMQGKYGPEWRHSCTTGGRFKDFEWKRDLTTGRDAIWQFTSASWWEWDQGSALLFWRWPTSESRKAARDGFPIFVRDQKVKLSYTPTCQSISVDMKMRLGEKIGDIRRKKYVTKLKNNNICSFVDFFGVPKVLGPPPEEEILDIRVVYDGTRCGLNPLIWSPRFWLPTAHTAIRKVSYLSWMADYDFGEFFLNFPLPHHLRKFVGIQMQDLKEEIEEGGGEPVDGGEAWNRLLMGFKPSPYNSIRHYYHAEEFVTGNPIQPNSPLRWDWVVLNLPGPRLKDRAPFDPRFPWVYLWDDKRKCIAGSVVVYMDDGRINGNSVERAWQVLHRCSSRLQYLGMNVSLRKTKPPSQVPGAWAGALVACHHDKVTKSVTLAKWNKGKECGRRISEEMKKSCDGLLAFKPLERDRGFFVHLGMTFPSFNPFLKGIHLTLDSWRPNRKDDGWKMMDKEWIAYLNSLPEDKARSHALDLGGAKPPSQVKQAARLKADMKAILQLLNCDAPPIVNVRSKKWVEVIFGFGDASSIGFGDIFLGKEGLVRQIGIWIYGENLESSNFREFKNLIDALEREGDKGKLKDAFVLLCTDNSVVEIALFKGTSSSSKLLALVIRYRVLELRYGFRGLIIHVAGTRMIAQGTDGCSRGVTSEGVLAGKSMMSFLPLNMSAVQREPKLLPWVRSWAGEELIVLEPNDWFVRAHDIAGWEKQKSGFEFPYVKRSIYLWVPPPAACRVALEELRKARIKRHLSVHIMLVPRLMLPLWRKQFHKSFDLIVKIEAKTTIWGANMFEPLLLAIAFPYLRYAPFEVRFTPKMFQLQRDVQKMSQGDCLHAGDILRKFLLVAWKFPSMSRGMVRKVLYFEQ